MAAATTPLVRKAWTRGTSPSLAPSPQNAGSTLSCPGSQRSAGGDPGG
eukprot:CAMPEP_0114116516 /NCGR_PEP_ID=MMETSP0043_2-20121206/4539_1 /TAXON_ID=464988 /ORGANISM="Hemiselmis andersenii, Strain CCMP644" /LENGTH=47 /DNA_ID= /DNA_START= /DNA_END= /DNA_ORIENTATION=